MSNRSRSYTKSKLPRRAEIAKKRNSKYPPLETEEPVQEYPPSYYSFNNGVDHNLYTVPKQHNMTIFEWEVANAQAYLGTDNAEAIMDELAYRRVITKAEYIQWANNRQYCPGCFNDKCASYRKFHWIYQLYESDIDVTLCSKCYSIVGPGGPCEIDKLVGLDLLEAEDSVYFRVQQYIQLEAQEYL